VTRSGDEAIWMNRGRLVCLQAASTILEFKGNLPAGASESEPLNADQSG
jgi:hypothetical protein